MDHYMDNYLICHQTKTHRDPLLGLLQPLPIPNQPWQHIAMDFRSFPRSKTGFDAAFVVVDRLGKRAFAIPYHKITTTHDIVRLFITHIYP
jgi:hypothetical protein